MNCDNRCFRWLGLLWSVVLVAGTCLAAAGCGLAPDPREVGAVPWLSPDRRWGVGTAEFNRRVEADSFPSAAQVGE
jgi:hypothetical protein